jgi:hypothetical protein
VANAAAASLPDDGRGCDRTQHFVGGLHELGLVEGEISLLGFGDVAAIPVWHVQNNPNQRVISTNAPTGCTEHRASPPWKTYGPPGRAGI